MSFWKRDDPTPAPFLQEPGPVEERSAAELMVESVRLLRESLKLEAAEQRSPIQQALQSDEEKLAAAQKTADTMGLRQALGRSVESLRYHHSWIHKDDKWRTPGMGIYVKAGESKKVDRTEHIGLLLTVEDRPYVLTWERTQGYHGDGVYGVIRFQTEQQHTLFAVEYGTTYQYDMEQIIPRAVKKLEVGEWVHDLVKLAERLRASDELRSTEFRAKITAERAREI